MNTTRQKIRLLVRKMTSKQIDAARDVWYTTYLTLSGVIGEKPAFVKADEARDAFIINLMEAQP